MSIIYRVQQKLINNYVNVSKTNQLCKHKHTQRKHVQLAFTCSKSTIKILEQGVKDIQR